MRGTSPYLILLGAIIAEVIATSSLKASQGFTRLWPSLVVVAGYGVAFWLLSLTLIKIPTGIAERAMARGSTAGLELLVDEDRQQRASTLLRDVAYVIEAHFELTPRAGPDDSPAKHLDLFNRRARKGQCFHQPCLGCREFPAAVALIEPGHALPAPAPELRGERDLGWMLLDIDYAADRGSHFFRARMKDGVIDVRAMNEAASTTAGRRPVATLEMTLLRSISYLLLSAERSHFDPWWSAATA